MSQVDPQSDSPVFAHGRGLTPQVTTPASPWTTALLLLAAGAVGLAVFTGLQAGQKAKVRASERAYQAANPPYAPPPAPMLIAPPTPMAPPQPSIVANAPTGAAMSAASGDIDPFARLHAPAMIVDLSGQRQMSQSATMSTPSATLGPASGPNSAANAELSAEERFAARVAGATAEAAKASRLKAPEYLVAQGAVIPAVLETAINSSLPGFARAVVTRDVRGFDGSKVLIPKGSKLVGQYRSGVAVGQSRAFVVWSRLLTPDGVSVDIGSPAGDELGRGGLAGETDNHFFQRFGSSMLLSVLSAGLDAAVGDRGGGAAIFIGAPSQAASVAQTALQKQSDIPATIKVAQGEPIRVFVAHDLDFSGVGAGLISTPSQ